jgi:hypothetical protein
MAEIPPLPDDVVELGRRLIPSAAFLIGCARSGTSILGEALAAHPRVQYRFELSPLWQRIFPDADDDRLEAERATPELARECYEALASEARLGPGQILLEKNPKHVLRVRFLARLFPWARFVHLLRDGRDTAASLMFRNRGASWGHLRVPGWRDLLAHYPNENHIRCAHQWRLAVEAAREGARSLPPGAWREVRYEELLREPRVVVESVLSFLGLDLVPAVAAFLPKIQNATRGSYHARKQVRHYVENHTRRVGRYRENLSAEQLAEVEAACGDLLRALGYLHAGGAGAAPGGQG